MNGKIRLQYLGAITKKGELSKFISPYNLKEFFENGKKLYLYKKVGKGKFSKFVPVIETQLIINIANELGYTLVYRNDSPRGGKLGDYVVMKRKNKKAIKKLINLLSLENNV